MTISKALKKLYTAMCGGETNKNTAGDLINAIADDYTGGGGGDDNDYRVDIEPVVDEQTQQLVIKVNKSIADIYAAAVALKHVWANITVPGVATTYQRMEITQYANVENTYQVVFGGVQHDEVAVKAVVLFGSNNNAGDPADDSWYYAE